MDETSFTLKTANGPIDLMVSDERCPADAPVIVGAESGFACLRIDVLERPDLPWEPERRNRLLQLADAMRGSSKGQWLAFARNPDGGSVAMVQSERGPFYEAHHPNSRGPVWRDFYFSAASVLFDQIDSQTDATDVRLLHPTGYGWPPQLAESFFDGLARRADRGKLSLERVWIQMNSCGLRDPAALGAAVEALNHELTEYKGARPVHADRVWRTSPAEAFAIAGLDDVTLVRVEATDRPRPNERVAA